MKTRFYVLLAIFISLMAFACRNSQQIEKAQFQKLITEFHQAFDQRDFYTLRSLCSDDMYWYTLDGRALARDKMADFFLPMMSHWKEIHTEISDIEVKGQDDLAVARYSSIIHIKVGEKETEMKNIHTMIFTRQDGGWKIWQHHMSTR